MAVVDPVPRQDRRQATERAILDVARRRFLEDGFDAVTLRSIAAEAGVDPSLAVHHFGSKIHLFLEALSHGAPVHGYLTAPLTCDRAALGTELAERVFDESPEGRSAVRLHAIVSGASGRSAVRDVVQRMQDTFVVEPIVEALGDEPHAETRARLIAAALAGALDYRANIGDATPLLERSMLVTAYGAAIQTLIDVPLED